MQKIKEDLISSMKNHEKEKKLILSTLIGEIQRIPPSVIENGEKTHSTSQIISVIKKIIEANKITKNEDENQYLVKYLPKELSYDELYSEIKNYIKENSLSGMKDMGKIMRYLKEKYDGGYDGRVAGDIAKSML